MTSEQQQTINSYNKTAAEYASTIGSLTNYNHTYDCFASYLRDGNRLLDLACGPGQISAYLKKHLPLEIVGIDLSDTMLTLAREKIPDGQFYNKSIITYYEEQPFDAVVLGFGLPYLSEDQAIQCLENIERSLKNNGLIYLSFMSGNGSKLEKTSFGGQNDFLIFYHQKETIMNCLLRLNLIIINQFILDYTEADGSLSKDIVLIARKSG